MGDGEKDSELYPTSTPGSPQTSLPGPSEADIEQDAPHLPYEPRWGADEPAGPESPE